MKNKTHEVDMTSGPLVKNIIIYSLPLMLSGMLQLLYNAADTVVVGRFVGDTALAAVGSTGSLVNLILNLSLGLSVGSSVAVAQYYGARDNKSVSQVVHTSILISIFLGIITTVIGVVYSKTFLALMKTPDEVLELSSLYLKIYFAGSVPSMIFNFGSSILRAIGDTKRPLIFLTLSGLVNVILNLVFVIVFNMGVAGVAISTVISQIMSAILVITALIKMEGPCKLIFKELQIHRDKFFMILRIGLPAGLQSSIFSFSNVLIQSSINAFGEIVMAANTAASNIDGFIYIACNSFYHSSLSFTGQNYGAKKYDRIGKVLRICVILASAVGFFLGIMSRIFGKSLLSIYSDNPEVIKFGLERLEILGITYFLCGIMEVLVGAIRGLGSSIVPMIVSIIGICGIRIGWIYTFFAMNKTLGNLYISYTVSWAVVSLVHYITFRHIYKKIKRENTTI